jgi:SAM-dependent methyltransferase
MAQRTSGTYRLTGVPWIYKALMSSLGSDQAIERYVREVLKPSTGMKMLDVGCGPATVLSYLPQVNYTGIDLNEKHIAFAREAFGDRGRFLVGNVATDVNEDEGTFDLINASAILHHLSDGEANSLFLSLARLLRKDGRIVTLDNVWLPSQRTFVKLINTLDAGLNIRTPEGYVGLLRGTGLDAETQIFHDLLRIPYDHIALTIRKA